MFGSEGLGATMGDVMAEGIGMGAGAWLRLAGFRGGDAVAGDGAVARTGDWGDPDARRGVGLLKGELDG